MVTDWLNWSVDFTVLQMVLTIKLTSSALNYYDGCQPDAVKEVTCLPGRIKKEKLSSRSLVTSFESREQRAESGMVSHKSWHE